MISCSPKLHNELETFLGELMSTFQNDGLPYPQNFPVWSKPVSALKPSRDEQDLSVCASNMNITTCRAENSAAACIIKIVQ